MRTLYPPADSSAMPERMTALLNRLATMTGPGKPAGTDDSRQDKR
ncbi:hypothetical protein [Prosthecodimorpha hirschii]|nr:hypothetical protein [Prosthecomicrobium hirschii]